MYLCKNKDIYSSVPCASSISKTWSFAFLRLLLSARKSSSSSSASISIFSPSTQERVFIFPSTYAFGIPLDAIYPPLLIKSHASLSTSLCTYPLLITSYTRTKQITSPMTTPIKADANNVMLLTLIEDLSSIDAFIFLITPIVPKI